MTTAEDLEQDHEQEVMEEIAISSDLDTEFIKQSAFFAHWSFLAARAQDAMRALEEKVEVSFYELYNEYRQDHSDAKENECKSFVRTHAKHQRLTAGLRRSQYQADILKAAVRAFDMRKDMLVQLGALRRHEHDSTDIKTKAQAATRIIKRTMRRKERHDDGDSEE